MNPYKTNTRLPIKAHHQGLPSRTAFHTNQPPPISAIPARTKTASALMIVGSVQRKISSPPPPRTATAEAAAELESPFLFVRDDSFFPAVQNLHLRFWELVLCCSPSCCARGEPSSVFPSATATNSLSMVRNTVRLGISLVADDIGEIHAVAESKVREKTGNCFSNNIIK